MPCVGAKAIGIWLMDGIASAFQCHTMYFYLMCVQFHCSSSRTASDTRGSIAKIAIWGDGRAYHRCMEPVFDEHDGDVDSSASGVLLCGPHLEACVAACPPLARIDFIVFQWAVKYDSDDTLLP